MLQSNLNEVKYLSLVDHKYGLDIEVPGSAILSSFGFNVLALWHDAIGLAVFCGVFVVLAYASMHLLRTCTFARTRTHCRKHLLSICGLPRALRTALRRALPGSGAVK